MSYLRYLCLFASSSVQHYCVGLFVFFFFLFVFVLCLVSMLPVSLDCSFLIAPSVFCNVYFKHIEHYKQCTNRIYSWRL